MFPVSSLIIDYNSTLFRWLQFHFIQRRIIFLDQLLDAWFKVGRFLIFNKCYLVIYCNNNILFTFFATFDEVSFIHNTRYVMWCYSYLSDCFVSSFASHLIIDFICINTVGLTVNNISILYKMWNLNTYEVENISYIKWCIFSR